MQGYQAEGALLRFDRSHNMGSYPNQSTVFQGKQSRYVINESTSGFIFVMKVEKFYS